jgi:hypothetical protein
LDLVGAAMSVNLSGQIQAMSPMGEVLFSKGDRNRLFRLAGHRAGLYWIATWLPKRWDYAYALSLGWRQRPPRDPGLVVKKIVDHQPFYETGEFIYNANRAAPYVSAAAGRVNLTITVPIGHGLKPDLAKVFRYVPRHEVNAVADAFKWSVLMILNDGTSTISKGRGIGKKRLSQEIRAQAKSAQYNRWGVKKGEIHKGNAALISRAAALRAERAPLEGRKRRQSERYANYIEAQQGDINRAARIRSDNAARQRRWRHRERAAIASHFSHL